MIDPKNNSHAIIYYYEHDDLYLFDSKLEHKYKK